MDFKKYCKNCGQVVEETCMENVKDRLFKCNCMDRLLRYNEVISGYTKNSRIAQLKAMHQLMCNANDENIYMSWIYLMPDCPMEDDFIDLALDDNQYNECFDLFVKLIAKKGNRY